jgi:hypothetical protein
LLFAYINLHFVFFQVREWAPLYQRIAKSPTDFQVLANEYGRGFIAELDYRLEAHHTQRFNDEMRARKMDTVVCSPKVFHHMSTGKILITEWIEGTRIDQSPDVEDIPRLCSVALNAYLVMLLETRSLHCDPHPGNLVVTTDGKLCILDFGMVLHIDPALQWSLLEYVAHLTSGDFDALPEDMAKLGFLRADKVDFVRRSGVLEPLKYFLEQAGKGGGAGQVKHRIFDDLRAKHPGKTDGELRTLIRMEMEQQLLEIVNRESVATGLTVELEELQRQNQDAFRIPEWFVYTSRAFLTLEGVSLAADEDYSLIKSCFPYIAKRLLADDDPRARKALRDILYGVGGSSIDIERLASLADGFSSYTTTTKTVYTKDSDGKPFIPATGGTERLSDHERRVRTAEVEAVVALAKDSADILLSPKGSMVQRLLLEESAKAASARVKDALRHAVTGPEKFRKSLPLLGVLLPPLPFEDYVRSQVVPFIEKTSEEVNALELTEKLSQSLTSNAPNNGRDTRRVATKFIKKLRELDPEHAAMVIRELRENLPRYRPLVTALGNKFVTILLNTASHNIESTLNKIESSGMIGVTARSISTVAQEGAKALNKGQDNHNAFQAVRVQLPGNSTIV